MHVIGDNIYNLMSKYFNLIIKSKQPTSHKEINAIISIPILRLMFLSGTHKLRGKDSCDL